MQYLLIDFDNEKYWLEMNEQLIALRQVIVDKASNIHVSCREDCLAEGIVQLDELDGTYKEILQDEFESMWVSALRPYCEEWLKIKEKYTVGRNVEGICKYFYPQGAIIRGEDYVASYKGKKEILFNESLVAQIVGYDEQNLWLVLE